MLRGIAPSALVFTGEQRRSMSPDMIDEIKESRGGGDALQIIVWRGSQTLGSGILPNDLALTADVRGIIGNFITIVQIL